MLKALCYLLERLMSGNDQLTDNCLFCKLAETEVVVLENELAYALLDKYPVTKGHTLFIPKRHMLTYFDMTYDENAAVFELIKARKTQLEELDPSIKGFNIGVNNGRAAGQTVMHCHVHLIPRRSGDVKKPRGGVRGVLPEKRSYPVDDDNQGL